MAKLEIYGWLLETSWGVIPKDRLQDVMDALDNEEFDRDDFEDILDQYHETGINTDLDIEIFVDGEKQDFDASNFADELSEPVEVEDDINENEYFLIEETASKGIAYICEITGEYDPEKISVWFYNYALGNSGVGVRVLELDYDEQECEDRDLETHGYSIKLLNPDGTLHEANEEGSENHNISPKSSDTYQKIYVFRDKTSYENFCNYIKEELQQNIDEGFDDTVITYSGTNSDELTITFENTSEELAFTPDPDMGWVEEEIGEISVRWSPREPTE